MFRVIDDTIYYNGQPLAVITMPLCGAKLDAVDDLNERDMYTFDDVSDVVREITSDVNHVIDVALTDAIEAFWISGQQSDLITADVKARLVEALTMTLAQWRAV